MANPATSLDEAQPAGEFANPFRGLEYYREEDSSRFFGRATECKILVGHLRTARLTLVYAESGVGKSSLLRAGVAATLATAARRSIARRGTPEIVPVVFNRWKDNPLDDLTTAIAAQAHAYAKLIAEAGFPAPSRYDLDREPGADDSASPLGDDDAGMVAARPKGISLAQAIHVATDQLDATMGIILDQFEELFNYQKKHPEPLADQLAQCVNDPTVRADFVIAVREDALGRVGDLLKQRIGNVYGNYFHLGYLTRDAAREAIERPIPKGVAVGEGLTGAVLNDVRRHNLELGAGRQAEEGGPQSNTLADEIEAPFLQLVMERLWDKEKQRWEQWPDEPRELRRSTLEDEMGGAATIVAEHFDRALKGLSTAQRNTATEIFSELVTPSGARIAHTANDLAEMAHQSVAATGAVLNVLERQRIVRKADRAPGRGDDRWELFHDRLAQPILDWGKEQEKIRLAEEAQERAREARRFKRLAQAIFALALVCILLLGGAIVLWRYAISKKRAAVLEATTARSLALASDVDVISAERPDVALLLALAAYRIRPDGPSASAVTASLEAFRRTGALAMLNGNPDGVDAVAFTHDGRMLASAGGDGTITLWDVSTHRQIGSPLQSSKVDGVWDVAFAPDGKTIASAGGFDPSVHVWDVGSGKPKLIGDFVVDRKHGFAYSVALSPDGHTLAVATSLSGVELWDFKTHAKSSQLNCGPGKVASVALSANGRLLACGGYDKTIWLWGLGAAPAKPRLLGRLIGSRATIYALSFSRNATLASAGADGTLRFWNVRLRTEIGRPLRTGQGAVNSIAFSPDGMSLASAGRDGTVRVWNVDTRTQLAVLRGHTGTVLSVAFDPKGGTIASAGIDRTLRLWPWPASSAVPFGTPLRGAKRPQSSLAISLDNTIAAAGSDGTVRLWSAQTGAPLGRPLMGNWGAVSRVAFGSDGTTLAFIGSGGSLHLWDVRTHTALATPRAGAGLVSVAFGPQGQTLATGDTKGMLTLWSLRSRLVIARVRTGRGAVESVAFSPVGGLLASGGTTGTIRLWNARNLARVRTLSGSGDTVYTLAFSPDGLTLASGGTSSLVRLWSVRGETQRGVLSGTNGQVYALAFSPDGRTLASGGSDDAVRLWDVATGTELGSPLAANTGWVKSVAFTSDGKALASASSDSTVRVWRGIFWTGLSGFGQEVCTLVGMGLSRAEWNQYAPGVAYAYHTTCPKG